MAVKLYGVFSRIAVGCPGDHGHALVNGPSLDVPQLAQHQQPVWARLQRTGKDLLRDFNTPFPGKPQDADGGNLISGGDGGNGM